MWPRVELSVASSSSWPSEMKAQACLGFGAQHVGSSGPLFMLVVWFPHP